MRPFETRTNEKTVVFKLFNIDGLPCSGETDEGNVFTPVAGEVKLSVNFGAYNNVVDFNDLVHISDGDYKFTFDDTELEEVDGTWLMLRVKRNTGTPADQIRTQTVPILLKYDQDDVLGLLHQNAVVDNQTWDGSTTDMLTARLRVFATAADAAAATTGAPDDADGEIMRFTILVEYSAASRPERYQFVREL